MAYTNSTTANDPEWEGPPEGLWHGAPQELNPALLVNVRYAVNFWGHEANFHEAEARCHEAEDEAEAEYYDAEAE